MSKSRHKNENRGERGVRKMKKTIMIMDGNEAAAYAAKAAKIRVYPSYLITPITKVSEKIAEYVEKGDLNAEYLLMESEHSVAAAAFGAALAGARTFWASCSHGVVFLYEIPWCFALMRQPIGGYVASRSIGLWNIKPDKQDLWCLRDLGMLLWDCKSPQEVADRIVMGYKIAEDSNVRLPFTVATEGFEVSHNKERVCALNQELVDDFLPLYKPTQKIDFDNPQSFGCLSGSEPYYLMKIDMQKAMERAIPAAEKTQDEFYRIFGRRYKAATKYNWDNPKTVLVASGAAVDTARYFLKKRNIRDVGILEISMLRPFPKQEVYKALKDVENVKALDRAISLGGSGPGILFQEVNSCLSRIGDGPQISSSVAGLGGYDINEATILEAIDSAGKPKKPGNIFLPRDIENKLLSANRQSPAQTSNQQNRFVHPGHNACQGCPIPITARHILDVLGKDTIVLVPAGCATIIFGFYPQTALGAPLIHTAFAASASTASGIRAALDIHGRKNTNVVIMAGDGGTADIGFAALSAAVERNENIIYICNDNEAYMNTGVQRSGLTPQGAWTTTTPWGKKRFKKPIVEIIAAHMPPYVATATAPFLDDFKTKIKKASKAKGFSFINVLSPCPTGWGFPPNLTIEMGRLAVETGIWPLYHILDGRKWIIDYEPKFLRVDQYLSRQKRFRHLKEQDIEKIQQDIYYNWDWLKKLSQL
jgi:pyruvate/2-oxoacid:ferredoxin oxidoreductase beta subunit/pyruvate/2-oxoacid:ferredoxin oxidoreductase alpha subunit